MDAFRHGIAVNDGSVSAEESACTPPRDKAPGLVLVLAGNGRPLGDEACTMDIDDRTLYGRTDVEGRLHVDAQPTADHIRLYVGKAMIPYDVRLGVLSPVNEISGIQARLANLGYYNGPVDNRPDETTLLAIKAFQADNDLSPTGRPDDATRNALVTCHGC